MRNNFRHRSEGGRVWSMPFLDIYFPHGPFSTITSVAETSVASRIRVCVSVAC